MVQTVFVDGGFWLADDKLHSRKVLNVRARAVVRGSSSSNRGQIHRRRGRLLFVSDTRSTAARATGIPASHPTPWVALLASSVAVALSVLWLFLWLLAVSVLPSAMPEGMKVVWPSGFDAVVLVVRRVAEPLLAVALLVAAWRYGLRGRSRACWIAALAASCLAVVSIFL